MIPEHDRGGHRADPGPDRHSPGSAGWPRVPSLPRPRLLDRLAAASRLTLVVAPPGYGKTTLLAQFAAEHVVRPVWHHADRVDADPARFAARLRRDLPGAAVDAEDLFAAVENGGEPMTLIVDDAQLLVGTPTERLLERFLTHGPPGRSLVLASRRTPELNVVRAEIGPVTLISADDLRFRSWEVEQLFREVYGEPLPPDDVAVLARRTEGWAACLQLFHLSTLSRPLTDRRKAIKAIVGGPRFARAYLVRAILDEVPAELHSFLARTAVFEVMSADRCDRLLDRTDSQRRLEELERLTTLTSSEDGGVTFRYHEVLRRHLESALQDGLDADGGRVWFGRAGAILESDGALSEAVRAYARGDRWDDAARLLRAAGAQVISDGPATVWDLLPAQLVDDDPWLNLAVARRLSGEGRLAAARERYLNAEVLFPDRDDRDLAARERRLVELWIDGLPRSGVHWMDRLRSAVRRRPDLLEGADAGADPVASTDGDRLVAAVAALLTGDVCTADRRLRAMSDAADGMLALATRLVEALVRSAGMASSVTGGGTDAVERLAADAERAGVSWVARQARALDGMRAGDGDAIDTVLAECEAAGDAWGALLARGAEAMRRLLAGEPALAAWADTLDRCRALEAGSLEAWSASFAALAAAAEGGPAAAAMARAAESFSRASGVWGAQAITALAQAVADPGHRSRSHRQATALAATHGLPWPSALADRLLAPAPAPVPAIVAGSAPMRLGCFGGFTLEVTGRPLDWRSLRPRAVSTLHLLAAHCPRPVHREMLLTLWPDLGDAAARHSLQVAVSSLRSFLLPDAPRGVDRLVRRHANTYVLELPDGSVSDVAVFTAGLRDADVARGAGDATAERAALAVAVGGYGGDLLPEEGTAEWVVDLRERYRLQAAAAAGRLAELALAEDDAASCVEAARRSVEIDRFLDGSWRVLISAYERSGDRAAAVRARRDYAEVLTALDVPVTPVPA